MKISYNEIVKYDWKKYWEGRFGVLTGLYNAKMDIFAMRKQWGAGFGSILFIYKSGMISYYRRKSETKKLGIFFANKVKKNSTVLVEWANALKNRSKKFISFLRTIKAPDEKTLLKIERELEQWHPYLMAIFIVSEYLPERTFKKYKKILTDSRVSSEPVYDLIEKKLAKYLAAQAGKLNNFSEIGAKAYFINQYEERIFLAEEAEKIEKVLVMKSKNVLKLVRGRIGYPGKASGIVRLIQNPENIKLFNRGDVLITGMTRPEFLHLIKKAGAIVTDAGGILSHAAIIARELKVPCVVGTETATHIFKDGDLVEVDADNGVVRIVKKAKR